MTTQVASAPAHPRGISVVVVNWNARDLLRDCLTSLALQDDRDFETVVVDNGSEDGSVAMVRAEFPGVVVVGETENLGFAEGCNRGIARASQPWIATLNNDAVAGPRWIAELRGALEHADARVGMLQSQMRFRNRRDQLNSTGVVVLGNGHARDRDYGAPARSDDRVEEVFCPTAGAALYRRAMLDEVRLASGYFDRAFFMYYEDVDLGWRCRLAGWGALYVPGARVDHVFRGSSRRRGGGFVTSLCLQNRLRTLLKNGSLRFIVRTSPRSARDVLQLTLAGSAGRAWRAALDGLRQRRAVGRLAVTPRAAVERRWVMRPRGWIWR